MQAVKILEDTKLAFRDFEKLADEYNVDEELKQTILDNLKMQL